MKPIQLKMTAFGPYKATEIIDFTKLGEHQLFTISGATGAGKTTIFDGICFALYGQASGEDRTEIRVLRSHFAEDHVQTEVSLTFKIQDEVYRIMRTVPYVKAGNKSETPGRVEFYKQQEANEVAMVDRQIVSEVNEKVIELLGFTLPQFSQIVMLPQGEFRKFLTSSTENKEEIMRKIFKTEPYDQIVGKLKAKRDEAQTALQNETQNNESYVDKITASLPNRESSTLFATFASEHMNTNQIVQGLEEECVYYREKTTEDEAQYEISLKKHTEMVSKFHQAKEVNNQFDELHRHQQTLTELTKQKPAMQEKEQKLAAAERTLVIEQLDNQYSELNKECKEKEMSLNKAENQLDEVNKQLTIATEIYDKEKLKEFERSELTEKLFGLKNLIPDVSELESRKETIKKLEKELISAQEELESSKKEALKKVEKIESTQKEIELLEEEISPLDQIADDLHVLRERNRLLEAYIEEVQQVDTFEKEKKMQYQRYEEEKEQYDELAADWMMSEAAALAEMLEEHEECPVCGSTEHPKKAHQTQEHTIVSKEALEKANEQLTAVEADYRKAVANLESASERVKKQEQSLIQLEIDLKEIEKVSRQSKEEMTRLEQDQKRLRESRQTLINKKEKLKEQQALVEEANENQSKVEKTWNHIKSELQVEHSVYENKLQTIPEELRVLSTLEQRISKLEETEQNLNRAWEQAQEKYQQSEKTASEAILNLTYAKNALSEVQQKEQLAKDKFYKALEASEFASEEAYRVAKLDESTRKVLKVEIEQFNQRKHTTKERVSELTSRLEGKKQENLQEWEVVIDELKTAYEQALSEMNQSKSYAKVALELKESLLASTERVALLEKQFGKIADLHDVIRGQNELRLSFERYIQIEYLERIIQSANERLSQLSNGQFEFMRSDRQEKNRRQSGLSLDVYDAYTGQTRDVKTLSGGEKFNASLCLALGMADVIQSFQGSVSVDTMFIDEGFGSLDEESLNKAVDTLIELQKAGRMIGVISHVEELKMAFPARLEVTKSKEGHSKTTFVVK